jgi:hypothetical protein
MARMLYDVTDRRPGQIQRDLVACDPSNLQTLAIPIKAGQGQLLYGAFLTVRGEHTTVPGQAAGVLAHSVNTGLVEDGDVVTIYTGGRFLWPAIGRANPDAVPDQIAITSLRARGLSFEAVFTGVPEHWISLPS